MRIEQLILFETFL